MAYTKSDLRDKVGNLFSETFTEYETDTVPDISDSRLTHGATGMSGEFSFLYSDMRGSSSLSDSHRRKTITKIYKASHHCMVETIKYKAGKVRSFDGDRVLEVFSGGRKANDAVECAMFIVGSLIEVMQPNLKQYYKNESFDIGIGIATGKAMVSKAGVGYDQNNRDLVWTGDAPNLGAKLSDSASGFLTGRIGSCRKEVQKVVC